MSAIVGNAIALLGVASLVAACARYLWKDAQRGGCGSGCAGCSGCAGGSCIHCAGHIRKGNPS